MLATSVGSPRQHIQSALRKFLHARITTCTSKPQGAQLFRHRGQHNTQGSELSRLDSGGVVNSLMAAPAIPMRIRQSSAAPAEGVSKSPFGHAQVAPIALGAAEILDLLIKHWELCWQHGFILTCRMIGDCNFSI
jgi:hypothetical protein